MADQNLKTGEIDYFHQDKDGVRKITYEEYITGMKWLWEINSGPRSGPKKGVPFQGKSILKRPSRKRGPKKRGEWHYGYDDDDE